MKIAHLILTHAHPELLKRLIERLEHEDSDSYIHIDKKSDINQFEKVKEKRNVFFIQKRIKVYWGGYSIVQATLNSFEEILATGKKYDYINLLSGQDYPIQPVKVLHQFLETNPDKAFMHFLSVNDEWQEAITRVTKYHLANYHFPGQYKLEKLLNAILPERALPNAMTAVGRSQWFTATPECISYMVEYLKSNSTLRRFFKFSWAPDEMIFQTILYNSPLKHKMVNDNLLYVDWSAGGASPRTLTMDDAESILNSGKFFARKFNLSTDEKILNFIDEKVHNKVI